MARELGKKSVTQLDYLVASLRFLFAAIPGLQLGSFFGGISELLMSKMNHNFELGDGFKLIT